MTYELKRLSRDAVDAAHDRALHYRLLNQPRLAESICRDILDLDEAHQDARITLILSLCDQFGEHGSVPVGDVLPMARGLEDPYEREYYAGLVCERRANAQLQIGGHGAGGVAFDWFERAMGHYESAEKLRPEGNDDAVLRWNTCARILNARSDIRRRVEERGPQLLE